MPTLLQIIYTERKIDANGVSTDTAIGQEAFDDIKEALVPAKHAHPVYVTKKFSHDDNTRWYVEDSGRTGANGSVPMIYQVVLSKVHNPPEVYLDESLAMSSHKIHQVLNHGTLVEVDYGFVQTVAESRGTVSRNHEYKDTIQHGEMHKRRLAIVVKVRKTQVQVVPLSSVAPDASDKTAFLVSAQTLAKLHFYGNSGKQTWGIGSMIQTLSPSRLLPPSSYYLDKGVRKHARHQRYPDRITTAEQEAMRLALLHTIGVSNYEQLKKDSQNGRTAATDLAVAQQKIAKLQHEVSALRQDAVRHACVEELAVGWAKGLGLVFEDQVTDLRDLNADIAAEG